MAEPTKKQQTNIVNLVNKLLKTKEKDEFEKLDNKIDELIYDLYDLDQESVDIVNSFI